MVVFYPLNTLSTVILSNPYIVGTPNYDIFILMAPVIQNHTVPIFFLFISFTGLILYCIKLSKLNLYFSEFLSLNGQPQEKSGRDSKVERIQQTLSPEGCQGSLKLQHLDHVAHPVINDNKMLVNQDLTFSLP